MLEEKKKKDKSLAGDVRARTVGYITAGLGLVASLAWNEAIREFIRVVFPQEQDTLIAKLIYAFVMTIVVVAAGWYAARLFKEGE
jgi:hypothetical protein